MYKEALRPLFLVILFCMILTASTELAPNQWIPNILTTTVGVSGILVLVWINGLMAVGRMFAGPIVHKLSPIGLLIGFSIMSAIGLFSLGHGGNTTDGLRGGYRVCHRSMLLLADDAWGDQRTVP